MEAIEQFEHKGLTVKIHVDTDPESPREWDNLGTMVCWHNRYTLGDEQPSGEPSDFFATLISEKAYQRIERTAERKCAALSNVHGQAFWDAAADIERERVQALMTEAEKDNIILPLYLYDHSGITMRTSAFSCPWDSGQVGYIYVPLATLRAEYKSRAVTAAIRKRAIACLTQEVETYAEYLEGNVYGYVVETEEGDHLDSCWGFYGLDYCRSEAKDAADYYVKLMDAEREGELADHD